MRGSSEKMSLYNVNVSSFLNWGNLPITDFRWINSNYERKKPHPKPSTIYQRPHAKWAMSMEGFSTANCSVNAWSTMMINMSSSPRREDKGMRKNLESILLRKPSVFSTRFPRYFCLIRVGPNRDLMLLLRRRWMRRRCQIVIFTHRHHNMRVQHTLFQVFK